MFLRSPIGLAKAQRYILFIRANIGLDRLAPIDWEIQLAIDQMDHSQPSHAEVEGPMARVRAGNRI